MLKHLFRDTVLTLGFLTRLPLPSAIFVRNPDISLAQSSGAFPLAGFIIAFLYALPALLIGQILPIPIAVIITLALRIIVTGALHEDGLADIADGFWGGRTVERRLEIMKDPSIGTYGALALIIALALESACLIAIWQNHGNIAFIAAMFATAAISRSAIVWHWASLDNARGSGVAAASGEPDNQTRNLAVILGGTIGLLALLFSFGLTHIILVAVMIIGIIIGFQKLCLIKIGGCTGDTMGAIQRLIEISILLALATSFA